VNEAQDSVSHSSCHAVNSERENFSAEPAATLLRIRDVRGAMKIIEGGCYHLGGDGGRRHEMSDVERKYLVLMHGAPGSCVYPRGLLQMVTAASPEFPLAQLARPER